MKRFLTILTLIIIVWPAYLYMNAVDQNRITLDNLRSEVTEVQGAHSAILTDLCELGCSLTQTNNRVIDTILPAEQTLDLSVLDSCGIITNDKKHGSCVAIRPNLMLTAGHCVDAVSGARIEIDGQRYRILKQWRSEQYDIGFVEIEGKLPFVRLADKSPRLLDEVFLVGAPYNTVLERTIAKGIISYCERNIPDHVGLVQTDAEAAPGSSGSPLFNMDGKVIGVCIMKFGSSGVTLCEPVEHIISALEEYDARGE